MKRLLIISLKCDVQLKGFKMANSFIYHQKDLDFLLKQIEKANSVVAILGPTGGGKSTLINQLKNRFTDKEEIIFCDYYPIFIQSRNFPFYRIAASIIQEITNPEKKRLYRQSVRALKSIFSRGVWVKENDLKDTFVYNILNMIDAELREEVLKSIDSRTLNESKVIKDRELSRKEINGLATLLGAFIEDLLQELSAIKLVLIIQGFQYLRGSTAQFLIYQANHSPERCHWFFISDTEGRSGKRALKLFYSSLEFQNILFIEGLTKEMIRIWIREEKGVELSEDKIEKIFQAAGKSPGKISSWLSSPQFDPNDINEQKLANSGYLRDYINSLPADIRRFLRQLSVLDFPLTYEDYAFLTRFSPEEVEKFLQQLKQLKIFKEFHSFLWFKSRQLKDLIYEDILPNLIKKYHQNALRLLEQRYSDKIHRIIEDNTTYLISYTRHLHYAQEYRKSFHYNLRVGANKLKSGSHITALECLELAAEAGTLIGYENEVQVIRGNIGYLLYILGEIDEALSIHKKLSEYFARTGDKHNLSISLFYTGIISFNKGLYYDAKKSLSHFLEIAEKDKFPDQIPLARRVLADIEFIHGNLNEAKREYMSLFESLNKVENKHFQIHLLHSLGNLAIEEGKIVEAKNYFEQSIQLSEKINDLGAKAKSLCLLANVEILNQNIDEGLKLLQKARGFAQDSEEIADIAIISTLMGRIFYARGEYDKARKILENAHRIARALQLDKLLANINYYLGSLSYETGNCVEGRNYLLEALSLLNHQSPELAGRIYIKLANIQQDMGDIQEAISSLLKAEDFYQQIDNSYIKAQIYYNLAVNYRFLKDQTKTRDYLTKARETYNKISDKDELKLAQMKLQLALIDAGQSEQLEAELKKALEVLSNQGDHLILSKITFNMGIVAQKRQDYEHAKHYYQQNMEIANKHSLIGMMANSSLNMAYLLLNQKELEKAREKAEESLNYATELNREDLIAEALLLLGIIHMEDNEDDLAIENLEKALHLFSQKDNKNKMATAFKWLGEVYKKVDKIDLSLENFNNSLEIKKSIQDSSDFPELYFNIGSLLLEQGKLDEAEQHFSKALDALAFADDINLLILSLCQMGRIKLKKRKYKNALERFTTALKLDDEKNNSRYSPLINSYLAEIKWDIGTKLYAKYLGEIPQIKIIKN